MPGMFLRHTVKTKSDTMKALQYQQDVYKTLTLIPTEKQHLLVFELIHKLHIDVTVYLAGLQDKQ